MYENKVVLKGYVGAVRPPVALPDGRKVVNFSLATKISWRSREDGSLKSKTMWHSCAGFGAMAETLEAQCAPRLHVYVEGRLTYNERKFTNRAGVTVESDNAKVEVYLFQLVSPEPTPSPKQGGGEGVPQPASSGVAVPAKRPVADAWGRDTAF